MCIGAHPSWGGSEEDKFIQVSNHVCFTTTSTTRRTQSTAAQNRENTPTSTKRAHRLTVGRGASARREDGLYGLQSHVRTCGTVRIREKLRSRHPHAAASSKRGGAEGGGPQSVQIYYLVQEESSTVRGQFSRVTLKVSHHARHWGRGGRGPSAGSACCEGSAWGR